MSNPPFAAALLEPVDIAAESERGGAFQVLAPEDEIGFSVRDFTSNLDRVIGDDVLVLGLEFAVSADCPIDKVRCHAFGYGVFVNCLRPIGRKHEIAVATVDPAGVAMQAGQNISAIQLIANKGQQVIWQGLI